MENLDINGKITTDCIKSQDQFLYTNYYNICDGTVHKVPIGTVDIIGGLAATLFIGVMIYGIYRLIKATIDL